MEVKQKDKHFLSRKSVLKFFSDDMPDEEIERAFLKGKKKFEEIMQQKKGWVLYECDDPSSLISYQNPGAPSHVSMCVVDFFLNLKPESGKRYVCKTYKNYYLKDLSVAPVNHLFNAIPFSFLEFESTEFSDDGAVVEVPKEHSFIFREFLRESQPS